MLTDPEAHGYLEQNLFPVMAFIVTSKAPYWTGREIVLSLSRGISSTSSLLRSHGMKATLRCSQEKAVRECFRIETEGPCSHLDEGLAVRQ